MWLPKLLKIQRLASHLDTTYEFHQGVARLLQGENRDDDSQESNGSGKSIIPEAVSIALTGDLFRDATISELIRDGEEDAFVGFELYNTIYKKTLIINRTFYVKKSQVIELKFGSEDIKLSGVEEYKKRIIELIGISKDDLVNYFIVHKDNYTPFFSASDTLKKKIISRFSGADMLNGIDDLIKEDADKIDVLEKEKLLLKAEGKLEGYQDELAKLNETNFEQQKKKEIKELEMWIFDCEEDIKSYKDRLEKGKDVIKGIELDIKKLKSTKKILELVDEIDKSVADLITIQMEVKEADVEKIKEHQEVGEKLNKLKASLLETITCPSCDHKFSLKDKDFNAEKTKKQVIKFDKEYLKVQKELEEIKSDLFILDDELEKQAKEKKKHRTEIVEIDASALKLKSKLTEAQTLKTTLEGNIETSKTNIINHNKQIKVVEGRVEGLRKDQLKLQIKQNKIEVDNIEKEVVKLTNKVSEIEEWYTHFHKFNNWLSNSAIGSISGYTNNYLQDMKSDLQVLIEGETTLADGKSVREQIDIHILRNGIIQGRFGRYSSGERAKMSMASILALQKLINLNCESGGLDLLYCDELMESVDSVGCRGVMKALNNLNQTIEIVTHVNHNFKDVEIVTVVKEGGVSKILEI